MGCLQCNDLWQKVINFKAKDTEITSEDLKKIIFTGTSDIKYDSDCKTLTITIRDGKDGQDGRDGETLPFASGQAVKNTWLFGTGETSEVNPLIRLSEISDIITVFASDQRVENTWLAGNTTKENPLIRITDAKDALPKELQQRITQGDNVTIIPTSDGIQISATGGSAGDTYWKNTSQPKTITPSDGYDNIDMTNKSITNILGLTSFINSAENFDIFNKDKNALVLQMGIYKVDWYNSNRGKNYFTAVTSATETKSNWTNENFANIVSIDHINQKVDANWDAVKEIPLNKAKEKLNNNYYVINSQIDSNGDWSWGMIMGYKPDGSNTLGTPDVVYVTSGFKMYLTINDKSQSNSFISIRQNNLKIDMYQNDRAINWQDLNTVLRADFNPSFKPFNIYKLSISDQLLNLKDDYATRNDQDQTKVYTFTDKGWTHVKLYKTWLDSRNNELTWNDTNKTISMIYSAEDNFLQDLLNLQGVPPIITGFLKQSEVKYERN